MPGVHRITQTANSPRKQDVGRMGDSALLDIFYSRVLAK